MGQNSHPYREAQKSMSEAKPVEKIKKPMSKTNKIMLWGLAGIVSEIIMGFICDASWLNSGAKAGFFFGTVVWHVLIFMKIAFVIEGELK